MANEALKEIFEQGRINKDHRDVIIVAMVQNGASLNTAQNLYKEWAKEAGLVSTRVGHKAEALEFIGELDTDLEDADSRAEVRTKLVDKFGVATSTANDYIKAFCEANGIELPKSNFGGSTEDQEEIYSWIKNNPDCSSAEFREFMRVQMNRSPGSIDETYRGIKLARRLFKDGVVFA